MASIAVAHNIPVVQPESVNTPAGVAQLAAFAPDLLVVAAYGQILKPEVIAVPTRGAINVHASLLPKYRGASPIAHAILNGETVTGVTIIRITTGLDAGDMLARVEVPIPPFTTTGAMEAELGPIGAKLCLDVIARMKAGPLTGTKQDASLVTRAPKFTKEMGAIDWTRPAGRVVSHVYAMQPWPTAYTFLHRPGREPLRVIVTDVAISPMAEISDIDQSPTGSPGDVVPSPGTLRVACGVGAVELLAVQPAGKGRMTADDFRRGYVTPGSRFGPEGAAS